MTRHLRHMGPGSSVLYNHDKFNPEGAPGVHLCGYR